jgi:predicted ribosomally synthesized peptide with SipW-like signal peptide
MRDLISRRLHLEDPPEGGKSRLLFSVLVIGAALALVGGATFALFTDTQTASGDVVAGTIVLYVTDVTGADGEGENEGVFNVSAENILPGETQSWTIRLLNTGNRAWDLTSISTVGSAGADCDLTLGGEEFSVAFVSGPDDAGVDHSGVFHVDAAGGQNMIISVTLAGGAGNDCQGDTFSLLATFTVTQH